MLHGWQASYSATPGVSVRPAATARWSRELQRTVVDEHEMQRLLLSGCCRHLRIRAGRSAHASNPERDWTPSPKMRGLGNRMGISLIQITDLVKMVCNVAESSSDQRAEVWEHAARNYFEDRDVFGREGNVRCEFMQGGQRRR